jgi:hypothetical protein
LSGWFGTGPCSTFIPWPGDFRDLVEAVVDRMGAHAVGDRLELGQVFVDLPGIDGNIGERVLIPRKGA